MFSKSLKDFFKNPKITLPTVLFSLISFIFSNAIIKNENFSLLKDVNIYNDVQSIMNVIGSTLIYFSIFIIFVLFASPLILSWTNVMIKKIINNEDANLGESLKSSFQYYFRMLCINVLQGFIFIGLFIFFIVSIVSMAVKFQNTNNFSGVKYIILLLIVLALLFIFLAISLVPVQMVLIYENSSIIKSFSKGFKFGLNKFFPILGSTLLVIIISSILNLIFKKYEILSTLITSYMGIFIPVYVMNLYNNKKDEENYIIYQQEDKNMQIQEPSISEKNKNKTSDENKFII